VNTETSSHPSLASEGNAAMQRKGRYGCLIGCGVLGVFTLVLMIATGVISIPLGFATWFGSTMVIASPLCGTWQVIPAPSISVGSSISNINGVTAISSDDVWAAGFGTEFSLLEEDGDLPAIFHWDGSRLASVSGPSAQGVPYRTALLGIEALSTNDVWAVGAELGAVTIQWDGSQWSYVTNPKLGDFDTRLYSVAGTSQDDVWAVGTSRGLALRMHWDGSGWKEVRSLTPYTTAVLYAVTAISSDNVWAVGSTQEGAGPSSTAIEQWNGSEWGVVPSPNPCQVSNDLRDISAIGPNDIWVVGGCTDDEYRRVPLRAVTMHWAGASWKEVPVPKTTQSQYLIGVAARTEDDVWAVGLEHSWTGSDYAAPGNTLVLHWDGSQWSTVPTPSFSKGRFSDVAVADNGDVWTVGDIGNEALIARFQRAACPDPTPGNSLP
jgi:hypothetical protein